MLIVDQPELEARLLSHAGPKSVPITMKLNSFGTVIELNKYTSFTVKELMEQVSSICGLEASRIKLKSVEETQSRRIDLQIYLKETLTLPEEHRVLNTLQDARLIHNSVLMIEEKSEEELAGGSSQPENAEVVELLDDSESTRTVIANISGYEEFQRYQVDIDWTISKLRDFLVAQLDLMGEQRLKDLTEGRMFYKEEMENKLRNYEIFREGGTRIQVEMGRPCTMAEINVNVSMFKVLASYEQFYFNADVTVK